MTIDPSAGTALLVCHLQPPILATIPDQPVVETVAEVIATARGAGVQVLYANNSFRPGYPELPDDDPIRAIVEPGQLFARGVSDGVDDRVAPQPGDIEIATIRPSAFYGTDLEVVLSARRVNHLVIAGVSTTGIVLSTAIAADDRKLRVTALSDACFDRDVDAHRVVMGFFPRPPHSIRVITASEWATELAI